MLTLDELPAGPFGIVCDLLYALNLPPSSLVRHLTMEELEAEGRNDDDDGIDYEPSVSSSLDSGDDESYDDDFVESESDESGSDEDDRILHHLPPHLAPPRHHCSPLTMPGRLARVSKAANALVQGWVTELIEQRRRFVQDDSSMSFARELLAWRRLTEEELNIGEEDRPLDPPEDGEVRTSYMKGVAIYDSLICDSVDAVRLEAGPGLAEYVAAARKYSPNLDAAKIESATFMQLDRSRATFMYCTWDWMKHPGRTRFQLPLLRICCPLANMRDVFSYDWQRHNTLPMIWEPYPYPRGDHGDSFFDCSFAQQLAFELDPSVDSVECNTTWGLIRDVGADAHYSQTPGERPSEFQLKWAFKNDAGVFLEVEHGEDENDAPRHFLDFSPRTLQSATHAVIVLRHAWRTAHRPVFVAPKDDVLPLLAFSQWDPEF